MHADDRNTFRRLADNSRGLHYHCCFAIFTPSTYIILPLGKVCFNCIAVCTSLDFVLIFLVLNCLLATWLSFSCYLALQYNSSFHVFSLVNRTVLFMLFHSSIEHQDFTLLKQVWWHYHWLTAFGVEWISLLKLWVSRTEQLAIE